MQKIAYSADSKCDSRLGDARQLKAKDALSKVRKRLGHASKTGITQKFSRVPADLRLAKTALAQQF
jgi:hypothetical protein